MKTATQYTQLKSPVFFAMTFAVALPTKDPILPIPSSKPRVDAKPLDGANQELNTLYCATCVAMSPNAWTIDPNIMNLYDRTVVAAAIKIAPIL